MQSALIDNAPYGMVCADSEQQASDVLKKDTSIIAILIDATLMRSTPAEWLGGLRKELAWSGIPVLFLLPPEAYETKDLLQSFDAPAVEYKEGITDSVEIIHELQKILTKGAL